MRLSSGLFAGAASNAYPISNQSYPLRMLDSTVTPSNMLFVRDHFNQPEVSLDSWSLRIEGHVRRPCEISFPDLVELPSVRMEAFLECAGNAANGSAVSNGVWEGVPLRALLQAAEPLEGAATVQLEGADTGKLFDDTPVLPYSQVIPIAHCLDAAALVAYKYNELTLPMRNGFPARALFAGLYGMNSVKWLRRVTVLRADEKGGVFERSGMNRLYNRVRAASGAEQVSRVSSVRVKSAFVWPTNGLKLPAGQYSIWGFAWSGGGAVRKVSVSVDNGKEWTPARLESQNGSRSWVRWRYEWKARPGAYALMSCAEDVTGARQPLARDPARKDGYELNWCAPIQCSVA